MKVTCSSKGLLSSVLALLKSSGEPYRRLQLQIHSASSLGLAANCNSFSIFCVIELGKQRCRTPSVMGGYNPSWEYKVWLLFAISLSECVQFSVNSLTLMMTIIF